MEGTKELNILGMYHTHTTYSKHNHGKNSVFEMIESAENLGLKEYGIADHGPKHCYGIKTSKIKDERKEIDEENQNRSMQTKMSIELNLLGNNGETDLPTNEANVFDLRFVGFHKAGRVDLKNFFTFLLPNIFFHNSKTVIERNTNAYINAIKKYKMDLITHPQEYIKVDLLKLAKACEENNCYLELNNKHLKYTVAEIKEVLRETNVKFLIGSDAHRKEDILKLDKVSKFISEANIPEERIANLNKIPNFEKKY